MSEILVDEGIRQCYENLGVELISFTVSEQSQASNLTLNAFRLDFFFSIAFFSLIVFLSSNNVKY